jgi:hypothetical protein
MAKGLFTVGFSVEEVLAILAQAKKDVLAGRDLSSYGDQGKSVSKTRSMTLAEIIDECKHALRYLDPDTYGLNRSGRRVHANFSAENDL